MTKKETTEMLREMRKDLSFEPSAVNRSWWLKQQIETLTSAINYLKKKKK